MSSPDVVLAVNAGSGSLSIDAFTPDSVEAADFATAPIWSLRFTRHSTPRRAEIEGNGASASFELDEDEPDGPATALDRGLLMLWRGDTAVIDSPERIVAVGHRIVHGGSHTDRHAVAYDAARSVASSAALDAAHDACRYAPLHNPPALALLERMRQVLPGASHALCFDTAFHAALPEAARTYAGPSSWADRGLRRYGFHGLAHERTARRAARLLGRPLDAVKLISAHFGGGCSATAVRDGASVDTTMGLTPNEGFAMAERSGSVDPGLILCLMREDGLDPDALEHLLNHESGLMGLTSGRTGDVSEVHRLAEGGDAQARAALDVYVHRARREIASMRASLDGLDALVFSGSAVRDAPWLRKAVVDGLEHLGVRIDPALNAAASGDADVDVGAADAAVRTFSVEADEAVGIAEIALSLALSRRGACSEG